MFTQKGYLMTTAQEEADVVLDQHLLGARHGRAEGAQQDELDAAPAQEPSRRWSTASWVHGAEPRRRAARRRPPTWWSARRSITRSRSTWTRSSKRAPRRAWTTSGFDRRHRRGGGIAKHHPRWRSARRWRDRLRVDHAGLQHEVLVLHRPLHPRLRARPADQRDRRRGQRPGRRREFARSHLLGQIVNLYGRHEFPKVDGKSPFVQLLEAGLPRSTGIERVRFTSPHPVGYKQDLIEAFGYIPKLASTCTSRCSPAATEILKAMHRPYKTAKFDRPVRRRSAPRGPGHRDHDGCHRRLPR